MSLKSLAETLGLSKTTVSRALDGYEDVAEATRRRVQAAAEAAGYRPNALARRLSRGASETVAVVVPATSGRRYEPLFVELAAAIGAQLADDNLDLMLLTPRPGEPEVAVYERLWRARRADGVVVVRTLVHDERVAFLQQVGLPFVCFGRTEATQPYAFVDGDGEAAFAQATRRLITLGHRRLAFLAGPERITAMHIRRAGFLAAAREAGVAHRVATGGFDEAAGEAMAAAELATPDPPTALVCATDRLALGAMGAVRAAGLEPGRDIAVIGHDNLPFSAYTDPPLATMEVPLEAAGAAVATMLVRLIGGARPGDLSTIHQVVPHWRASLGGPVTASGR